ncbi:MAG: hypothetical protein COU65_02865 [Candidatus Pacebacteria bacterium CG10_big_fil_rev_8_21_14_0_10_42_12]|nr:MAG: hypothetical protein COU65_02865 [Candidatus Pacebacteria bacterium CG10_big_fil_rev_8_21_14_0_10_42_12]
MAVAGLQPTLAALHANQALLVIEAPALVINTALIIQSVMLAIHAGITVVEILLILRAVLVLP